MNLLGLCPIHFKHTNQNSFNSEGIVFLRAPCLFLCLSLSLSPSLPIHRLLNKFSSVYLCIQLYFCVLILSLSLTHSLYLSLHRRLEELCLWCVCKIVFNCVMSLCAFSVQTQSLLHEAVGPDQRLLLFSRPSCYLASDSFQAEEKPLGLGRIAQVHEA